MILGTDIRNAYELILDLRENALRVGQEKIKLCMAKMAGSANHSIKQVAWVEKEVNKFAGFVCGNAHSEH